jgi:hypothetical protein
MKLKILAGLVGLLPLAILAAQEPQASKKDAETPKTIGAAKPPLCAGGDDTAALKAMLDHGNPQMTVVEIPATPTGCKISGPLLVKSNTHVIQNGLLKFDIASYPWPSPSTQYGMYTIKDGTHDVIIEGAGTLDGGHTDYQTLPSGCCMGGIVAGGPEVGAYGVTVSDITIRGLTIRNIPQWPIELDGGRNVLIDGVTAHDSVNTMAAGHGSRDVIMTNLRVYRIRDICLAFYRGVENGLITNSIVNNCGIGGGISVYTDWPLDVASPQFSKQVAINNNIAYSSEGGIDTGGIDVNGFGPEGQYSESTSVTFNLAHGHVSQGIAMTPAKHGLVAGNMTYDQGPVGYAAGINLLGAEGVLVSGNSSFDVTSDTATGLGLSMGTFCVRNLPSPSSGCDLTVPTTPFSLTERVSILDNYYYDSASTPSMLHAVKSSVAVPVVVAGNTYAPMIGAADAISYATGSHNADNDAQP